MKEFDIVYKQEEINDKYKTYNEAITVTITLAEYRFLVEERQRFECELLKLNDVIADLQMKYEDMKNKCYELQNKKFGCEPTLQTASLPTTVRSEPKVRSDNNG
jgi:predicted  nucleic acid-binding Zn-ribbon protein